MHLIIWDKIQQKSAIEPPSLPNQAGPNPLPLQVQSWIWEWVICKNIERYSTMATPFRRCRYTGPTTTSFWAVLYCLHVSSKTKQLWSGRVLGAFTCTPTGMNAPFSIASTKLMVPFRAERYICYPLDLAQLLCGVSFTCFVQRSPTAGGFLTYLH